jgi:hypothetical protein
MGPRQQGDVGEWSAIEWFGSRGVPVAIPLGHSPDYDLIADMDGVLLRVQVKTSTCLTPKGRYAVTLATRGGNRSWTGLVKHFRPDRCDRLFVLVADGRRWFIPADRVEGAAGVCLGGPKYAEFEVERGRPIQWRSSA